MRSAFPYFFKLNHYFLEAKRQNIALELLESERKYVINLSLILKIKATLQGPDVKRSTKERRYFHLACSLFWGTFLSLFFLLHPLSHFSFIHTEIFKHLKLISS